MAATYIEPIHVSEDKSNAQIFHDTINYVTNEKKTRGGELVSYYGCGPGTAAMEFTLNTEDYYSITGRQPCHDPDKTDRIAYHIRQSFKPGEIDPEEAQRIGYETAMRITGGNNAFVVGTHIDRHHIHCHTIVCAVTLDCTRKFTDPYYSHKTLVAPVSDKLCAENNLSVIESPGYGSGGYKLPADMTKEPTRRQLLERFMDKVLFESRPQDFEEFLQMLQAAGCKVKKRGKTFSFKIEGQERFFRLGSLSENHTEEAIRKRIEDMQKPLPVEEISYVPPADIPIGLSEEMPQEPLADSSDSPTAEQLPEQKTVPQLPPATTPPTKKVSLLIDLESSIKAANSPGYERWAKVFNLKQAAATLVYLQERNITDMETLAEEVQQARDGFNSLQSRIKEINTRQQDINALQKHIGSYRKTRDVYEQYRKAGYSKKFLAGNESAVSTHKEAKAYFDSLGMKKLPTIKSLQEEYSVLAEEKNALYANQKELRQNMVDMVTALNNVEKLLNYRDEEADKANARQTR